MAKKEVKVDDDLSKEFANQEEVKPNAGILSITDKGDKVELLVVIDKADYKLTDKLLVIKV